MFACSYVAVSEKDRETARRSVFVLCMPCDAARIFAFFQLFTGFAHFVYTTQKYDKLIITLTELLLGYLRTISYEWHFNFLKVNNLLCSAWLKLMSPPSFDLLLSIDYITQYILLSQQLNIFITNKQTQQTLRPKRTFPKKRKRQSKVQLY